ncbi:MAG: hypothetical protein R3A48_12920 [Polyangiales bacterium]
MERIVRALGYRVWTTPAEDSTRTVVIADTLRNAGTPRFSLRRVIEAGRVTADSNILSGREKTSIREAPSRVTVFSGGARGDSPAPPSPEVTNGFLFTDAALARVDENTPTSAPAMCSPTSARTVEGAQQEGARLIAEANEQLRRYEATVLYHRQDGRLWVPNTLCAVRDDLVGLDETQLVVAVSFSGGKQEGPRTRVSCLPLGALSETPVPA